MKKLILILCVISFACSSSDDENRSSESLIGVWKPMKDVEIIDDVEEVYIYTSCEQQSRYVFEANGNFIFTNYDDNDGCTLNNNGFISGVWERINDTQIRIMSEYESGSETDIPDSVDFPNENTMRIHYNSYYIEFVRVD
jgi:hypothetical protein